MNKYYQKLVPELKTLASDRYLFVLFLAMSILTVIFSIQLLLSISPSDLQIVSRYTAFGGTYLYRDQWFYQLLFPIFITLVAVSHILISKKTYDIINRPLALMFAWVGIFMVIYAWLLANTVLTVWSPL